MGLFSRGGQTGRERRAMQDHLRELDDMRRNNLGDLGQMTVEMASEGRFDRSRADRRSELEHKCKVRERIHLGNGVVEPGPVLVGQHRRHRLAHPQPDEIQQQLLLHQPLHGMVVPFTVFRQMSGADITATDHQQDRQQHPER